MRSIHGGVAVVVTTWRPWRVLGSAWGIAGVSWAYLSGSEASLGVGVHASVIDLFVMYAMENMHVSLVSLQLLGTLSKSKHGLSPVVLGPYRYLNSI